MINGWFLFGSREVKRAMRRSQRTKRKTLKADAWKEAKEAKEKRKAERKANREKAWKLKIAELRQKVLNSPDLVPNGQEWGEEDAMENDVVRHLLELVKFYKKKGEPVPLDMMSYFRQVFDYTNLFLEENDQEAYNTPNAKTPSEIANLVREIKDIVNFPDQELKTDLIENVYDKDLGMKYYLLKLRNVLPHYEEIIQQIPWIEDAYLDKSS